MRLLLHRPASAGAGTLEGIICLSRLVERGYQPIKEIRRDDRHHVVIAQNLFRASLSSRANKVAGGFMHQAGGVLDLLLGFRTYAELESGRRT